MAETKEVTSAVRSIEPEIDPADFTVAEIQEQVDTVDDVAVLDDMVSAEKAGKDRVGAKSALASRKDELINDTENEAEEEQDFVAREPNVKEDGAGTVKKICAARLIADEIGCGREILYGVARENEELDGWTDGDEFIALTESAMDRGNYITWSQQMFHAIVKFWAYADPSLETTRDGSYGHRFAKYLDRHEDEFLDLADEFWTNSMNDTLREAGYHPEQQFDE